MIFFSPGFQLPHVAIPFSHLQYYVPTVPNPILAKTLVGEKLGCYVADLKPCSCQRA